MKYFIHLSYKGTAYSGWQRQKATPETIQQKIEDALNSVLNSEIRIMGCGRTDAGVHATNYFAHFIHPTVIQKVTIYYLNRCLPDDIAIYDIFAVKPYVNAQKDAIKRTYEYHIQTNKNPFFMDQRSMVYLEERSLDIDKMKEFVGVIRRQDDFRSMCKRPDQYKSTRCNIMDCTIEKVEYGYVFRISANRFLQSMNRLLIGRMIDVAQGKLEISVIENCFKTGCAPKFPIPAPPQGLYLTNIEYPNNILAEAPNS